MEPNQEIIGSSDQSCLMNGNSDSLRSEIDQIADQLCAAVTGEFNFQIRAKTEDESIQKLSMLINFVIDAARRSLKDVEEKNNKLTELDRLKSDFLANISHELRTPLTLILAPLETIIKEHSSELPNMVQDNLERMQRNGMRLYTLVNDLLDISKVEAGRFEVRDELIDFNKCIKQIVEEAEGLAKNRELTLIFLPCQNLNPRYCDRKMLEKITLNLLSNAMKFTHAGGSITLKLALFGNDLHFTVQDTGSGIPADQLEHLFKRFHQVDSSLSRKHEGTGIGLALIKEFCELLGGKISVESEVGKGTQFTVILPERTDVNLNTESDQPSSESIRSTIKLVQASFMKPSSEVIKDLSPQDQTLPMILVVDDNSDMREYVTSLLKETFRVVQADNGLTALEYIKQQQPDVILSDVMMPVMDGFELTKTLKSNPEFKHIPLILITAKAGKEAIVSGLGTGADDYLPKPFTPEELVARSQAALRLHKNYDEISDINRNLQNEIDERRKLEEKNLKLNNKLMVAARQAGMADLATSVLHNVGNVLNSINTSASLLSEKLTMSKMSNLSKLSNLFEEHKQNIGEFIEKDQQGSQIPQFISKLAEGWSTERDFYINEIKSLEKNIHHIKEIIRKQNAMGCAMNIIEAIAPTQLVDDALSLTYSTLNKHHIMVHREVFYNEPVKLDRVKLLQVLVNLMRNSIDAILEAKCTTPTVTISLKEVDEHNFSILIKDNGIGVSAENSVKIFTHGFTTKREGHGFGLHSCANAIREMGGNIELVTDGVVRGAEFMIVLPKIYSEVQDN